jgi:ABC-type multidrug transport system fused ATPase/permease subunit
VLVGEVLSALGLRGAVITVGLEYHCGTGGSRLSAAQRQKIAIARALIKQPDLLVLNDATSALDGPSEAKVMSALGRLLEGRGLVWVLHRASLARNFEHVLVMSRGRLVEQGTPAELESHASTFKMLMAAE